MSISGGRIYNDSNISNTNILQQLGVNVIPDVTDTYDLGSQTNIFDDVFADKVNTNQINALGSSISLFSNLVPGNTVNIGTSANPVNSVISNNVNATTYTSPAPMIIDGTTSVSLRFNGTERILLNSGGVSFLGTSVSGCHVLSNNFNTIAVRASATSASSSWNLIDTTRSTPQSGRFDTVALQTNIGSTAVDRFVIRGDGRAHGRMNLSLCAPGQIPTDQGTYPLYVSGTSYTDNLELSPSGTISGSTAINISVNGVSIHSITRDSINAGGITTNSSGSYIGIGPSTSSSPGNRRTITYAGANADVGIASPSALNASSNGDKLVFGNTTAKKKAIGMSETSVWIQNITNGPAASIDFYVSSSSSATNMPVSITPSSLDISGGVSMWMLNSYYGKIRTDQPDSGSLVTETTGVGWFPYSGTNLDGWNSVRYTMYPEEFLNFYVYMCDESVPSFSSSDSVLYVIQTSPNGVTGFSELFVAQVNGNDNNLNSTFGCLRQGANSFIYVKPSTRISIPQGVFVRHWLYSVTDGGVETPFAGNVDLATKYECLQYIRRGT